MVLSLSGPAVGRIGIRDPGCQAGRVAGNDIDRYLAGLDEPRRSTLGRLAHYGGLFKRGLHFRYKLVNLFCALLPDVASGAVRGRLYRLA